MSETLRKMLRIIFWIAMLVAFSWMAHPSRGQDCAGGICNLLPSRPTVPINRPAVTNLAVVRIFADTRTGRNVGSGTLLEDGRVLTCAHLFSASPGEIAVIFSDGSSHKGRVVSLDRTWDLALLCISQQRQGVRIAAAAPKVGDRVQSCGYGRDGRYWCNQGRVLGYISPQGASSFETLEISGRARQGDSGGPIFNQRGELVAVLWGTNGRMVSGAYCGRIRRFLERIAPPPVPRPPATTQEPPPEPLFTMPPSGSNILIPPKQAPSDSLLLVELKKQAAQIVVLQAEVEALKKLEPIPRGNDGQPGPRGERGPAGPPGKVDYRNLPPIIVQTVKDGKVIESEQVFLGGVLSLRLVPVN